jgi:glutamate--cysteine ligase
LRQRPTSRISPFRFDPEVRVSGPSQVKDVPIDDRSQLVEFLASGSKPPEQWRIGTEHEKFGFRLDDLRPLPWDGPQGIEAVLRGLTRFGWAPVEENGKLIALLKDGASVTLEPARPARTLRRAAGNHSRHLLRSGLHLKEVKTVAEELGVGFLGMGFQPKWPREDMPWMPKGRYQIMRDYMPKRGNLGLDMMTRTCTVQVNLDFASEADMVKKFRVSLALQPIATALFADSPFTEGKPNGYQSYRSHIWTDTDPDRTGMLDFVFEDGFGFERYVDYLLDVPMYFVYRDGKYLDASGKASAISSPASCRCCRAIAHAQGLGRPHDHRLPRSAPEKVPGDARRRWRAVESPLRAAGVLGRPALRRRRRSMRPGTWSRTSPWKNATHCATACPSTR